MNVALGETTAASGEVAVPIGRIGIHLRGEITIIRKLLEEVTGIDDPASAKALSYAELRVRSLISLVELVFDIEDDAEGDGGSR